MEIDLSKNNLILGDCKDWLPSIPSGSIDMCYIDPPFFTQRDFGNFNDKWRGGMSEYIEWMQERVQEIHRVLKDTGSIFLHCDWHASHRLRVILDEVFAIKNFQNEIIVYYTAVGLKGKSNKFHQNTENIFYYCKNKGKHIWHDIFLKYDNPSKYRRANKHIWNPEKKKAENKRDENGKIKYFLVKEYKADNLIKLPALRGTEKVGYSTQKPEALLKRIIKCSTNKGDIVLDCFSGSGTTAKVASDLGRKFVVGDINPQAISITKDRLKGVDFELA